jgi:anhydro-N-acetylmuramic acid kinase
MSRSLATLLQLGAKPARTVTGMISGTSADSIDVAICQVQGIGRSLQVGLIHYEERSYDPQVRAQLLAPDRLDVRAIAELHVEVAEQFASAFRAAVDRAGLGIEQIDLIGSHGQTVYHHSGVAGARRATLQLGDGDVLAELTGVPVVFDFRAKDIAAGGEGAPLSPIADLILFQAGGAVRRAVLNLGGIANITVLDPDPMRVIGFDTGPANSLLDRLARRMTSGAMSCDRDGLIARSGKVNSAILDQLLNEDPYLARKPPKSTGFEMYGDAFLDRALKAHGRIDADLMATLTEFTARTVALAFDQLQNEGVSIDEIVVAGGGWKNPALMDRISALVAPRRVRASDELGVPSSAREAMAFAVLADLAIRGVPSFLPKVTGARRPVVLGKLAIARSADGEGELS